MEIVNEMRIPLRRKHRNSPFSSRGHDEEIRLTINIHLDTIDRNRAYRLASQIQKQ